jgi:hypothetical protein
VTDEPPRRPIAGAETGTARTSPLRLLGRWATPLIAALFVTTMIGIRWHRDSGFTSLLAFGGPKWEQRLPVLRPLPIAKDSGGGYDGQFGAQLAVTPDPRSSELQDALDNPAYRSRRILLAWTAHILGRGQPWRVLQVYALQNTLIWLCLAMFLWNELLVAPGRRATAIWFSCMFTLGALDSTRQSLTDLLPVFLLTMAVSATKRANNWLAVGALALAGLARETAVLGGAVLLPFGARQARSWYRPLARLAIVVCPIFLWMGWLVYAIPGSNLLGRGNFDWPGFAFTRHCLICISHLARGDTDSRYLFGLLGAVGLATQSLYILSRRKYDEPWWRAAVGYSLLLWVLGDEVWKGYWAAARVMLPLTFGFSLLIINERRFWTKMALANLALVTHGIWRMFP